MAFIDEFIDKTQKAGKFVCNKAVDAKDYVSYEYKAASLRSEADKKYKELGKLIFDNIEDESVVAEQKQNLVSDITKILTSLNELNAKNDKFKKICPACNAVSKANADFCSKCGSPLK